MDAVGTLESEVRELIRRSGLDPARDVPEVRRLVREAVSDYDERSLHGGMPTLPDLDEAAKALWDTVAGFGPLQRYFDDPSVEEIWVNEPSKVFIARDGIAELTTTILTADVLCSCQLSAPPPPSVGSVVPQPDVRSRTPGSVRLGPQSG